MSATMGQTPSAIAASRSGTKLVLGPSPPQAAVTSTPNQANRAAIDQHQALVTVVCLTARQRDSSTARPTTSAKLSAAALVHATGITVTRRAIASDGTV